MRLAAPDSLLVRRVAVLLAIQVVAVELTVRLSIIYTGFAFFYAAVTAAAFFAGIAGGCITIVVGVLVITYEVLPPKGSLTLQGPGELIGLFAFTGIGLVITVLVELTRYARETAEERARQLERQAVELQRGRGEAEALAHELEKSNVELESTIDEAKRARDAALASEERLRLVDEASRVLTSSLDYETTVAAVARLAVPSFADWCTVDLKVDEEIRRLAVAHVDPNKVRWARDVIDVKFRPRPDDATGVPAVIRTGRPVLVPVVTDDMLRQAARTAEHLQMLRDVGVHSVMIVPMTARGRTLGALTLIASRPNRRFGEMDLAIAQDLARRAAAAIDNAQLYRAALAANEAKANFLATMSHELRTPLTAIIGYEELLSDGVSGPISDTQRQQLRRIKASALHLLLLIDQILLYTRVESGHELPRVERTIALDVVSEAVSFVQPMAAERGLPVRAVDIAPSLELQTDPGKLRQMLINLLTNAIKFTPSGEVTARAFARDDDKVVFEVQDTGVGIDRKALKHIFDPFWQVQQTTTRESGGSGLGLTVTQRLATLLGGEVTVDSQPARGSTFRIILPRSLPQVQVRQRALT